jgi:hypothetical protein
MKTNKIPSLTPGEVSRFFEKVERVDTGCWRWLGGMLRKYGGVKIRGKMYGAHRVSYFIHNGRDPGNFHVLHRCDNPPCTNPEHLWLGTHADNMSDCYRKGRGAVGEGNASAKLDSTKVASIREEYEMVSTPHRKLAQKYGVSRSTICRIINGEYWKHIPFYGLAAERKE